MYTTVPLPVSPIENGVSPWNGQPLVVDPAWEYMRGKEDSFKCAADSLGIIFHRFYGWGTVEDFDALQEVLNTIHAKMGWKQRPWVLFSDCLALTGMDITARGRFLEIVLAQEHLRGIVFRSPSNLIKSLVELAVKFYNPAFELLVCDGWDTGYLRVSEWLSLPAPTLAGEPDGRIGADVTSHHEDIDEVLRILGRVAWNKPGFDLLEAAAKSSPWKQFFGMMATIKNDIDIMIARRDERLAELREINEVETALQQKMSAAFEASQRARVIFEQETSRNLMLSRVMIDTQKEILFALGEIIESRSRETANHIRRVAEYSTLLARCSGMNERMQQQILHASPMHDAGKIAIPDAILNKPGKLTEEEFAVMKDHTRFGWEMLRSSPLEIMKHAATIAYQHHEKWNGRGYPEGVSGENIHPFGRIVALADVFDALGSQRCYKEAWPLEKVLDLLRKERGEQFDPALVDVFFENLGEVLTIRERFPDATA